MRQRVVLLGLLETFARWRRCVSALVRSHWLPVAFRQRFAGPPPWERGMRVQARGGLPCWPRRIRTRTETWAGPRRSIRASRASWCSSSRLGAVMVMGSCSAWASRCPGRSLITRNTISRIVLDPARVGFILGRLPRLGVWCGIRGTDLQHTGHPPRSSHGRRVRGFRERA